jgi:hypothetical protein
VVLLVVVVVTAVTLILLQSAGAIHLPFLGGGASSAPGLHRMAGGLPAAPTVGTGLVGSA